MNDGLGDGETQACAIGATGDHWCKDGRQHVCGNAGAIVDNVHAAHEAVHL